MNSLEARRLARQQKILANQEGRIKRITLDQKIEPTLTETLPTEALATIDPVTTNNQTDKVIEEVLRSMAAFSKPESTSEPLVSTEPDILSLFQANSSTFVGQDLNDVKDSVLEKRGNQTFVQRWSPVFAWFFFGIAVRLILSSPDTSWVLAQNALSPFVLVIILTEFLGTNHQTADVSPQSSTSISGIFFLLLQMCGVQPHRINKLKRMVKLATIVSEKFSLYFVAFVSCHFCVA